MRHYKLPLVWVSEEPPFSKNRCWYQTITPAYGLELEYINATIESRNTEHWERSIQLDVLWETTH